MFTVLWCYLRNAAFKHDGVDYSAVRGPDGPGQPPRRDDRGRHHQAEDAGEQRRLQRRSATDYGKTSEARLLEADERQPDRSLPLPGRELLHGTRTALINSGGASSGATDLAEAVRTAVINKRAGGTGLISGRKAFQRPMARRRRAAATRSRTSTSRTRSRSRRAGVRRDPPRPSARSTRRSGVCARQPRRSAARVGLPIGALPSGLRTRLESTRR